MHFPVTAEDDPGQMSTESAIGDTLRAGLTGSVTPSTSSPPSPFEDSDLKLDDPSGDPFGLRKPYPEPILHEDRSTALRLAELSAEEMRNVPLFFGGVGDARHVFVTLIDANKQIRSKDALEARERSRGEGKLWRKNLSISMVLNDLKPAVLARDALLLLMLCRLGALSIGSSETKKEQEQKEEGKKSGGEAKKKELSPQAYTLATLIEVG